MGRTVDERLWAAIKTEYITTEVGYRKLAAKYGVALHTLSDRAKREKWPEQRAEHRTEVVTRTIQTVTDGAVEERAAHLRTLQQAADKLANVMAEVLDDPDSLKTASGKYDTKKLRDVSNVMRDMLVITRNVYDLPSIQEQSAMDIAAERLRLEQRKADAAERDGSDGVEVVLCAPELKEYSE